MKLNERNDQKRSLKTQLILIGYFSFSYFQAEFSKNSYAVSKCDMPKETTVFLIYFICVGITIAYMVNLFYRKFVSRWRKTKLKVSEKKL